MIMLFLICALSAFISSVNCNPHIPEVNILLNRTGASDGLFYYGSRLFFTDTHVNELCAYHLSNEQTFCATIRGGELSFALPIARDRRRFLVGFNNKIQLVPWNAKMNDPGALLENFMELRLQESERLQYGIGDPYSGLWFWTTIRGKRFTGKLYYYHPHVPRQPFSEYILGKSGLTNGIVWDVRDPSRFYFIDANNQRILSFIYDRTQRTFPANIGIAFDLHHWFRAKGHLIYNGNAVLGHMTIDTKGRLWVPLHGGSHVLQIDPHSTEVMQAIHIPAIRVSACAFGGARMNILYVSTLAYGADEIRPTGDQGGKIFSVTNLAEDVMGFEATPFVFH